MTTTYRAPHQIDKAKRYIEDIVSGARLCGRLERLAVERHLKLFDNPAYFFDEAAADWVLFVFSTFRHTSGDYYKTKFELLPWQAFSLYVTFGWKRRDTGKRLIRKSYIRTAKKSGKTELAAGVGVYGTFFDGENVAEVYSAANKYDQACICWKSAATITKLLSADSKRFADRLKTYNSKNYKELINQVDGSFFRPIASDSSTLDGVRPHIAIIDEYHEAPDSAIVDNFESAMVSRSQPLLYIITTSGFNINGPCHELEKTLIPILEGQLVDDSVFVLIFALDEADMENGPDKLPLWYNEKLWEKTNPSVGRTPTWEGLQSQFTKALNEGASQMTNFMTKNMNIWVRQSKNWVTDRVWVKGSKPIDFKSLYGREAYGAFDLSSKWDITASGLLFPPLPGETDFIFIPRFYCPEEGAQDRAKKDKVPYLRWAKDGSMILTDGNVTDHNRIRDDILEDATKFFIKKIFYDPWQSVQLAVELHEQGAPVESFAQQAPKFNAPIKEIEGLLAKGHLNHGGHEVLRWMAGNVVLWQNRTGLRMFDKEKSREKIDGMVVLAMCFAAYFEEMKNPGAKVTYGPDNPLTIF